VRLSLSRKMRDNASRNLQMKITNVELRKKFSIDNLNVIKVYLILNHFDTVR